MTQQTLKRVTLATIENYRAAANQATQAYRAGGQRLVGAVNSTIAQTIDGQIAKVAPEFILSMQKARVRVSGIVVKGIDQVVSRTEKAVDLGSNRATKQVIKVAAFAAGIENPMVASGLPTATRLSMLGAKLALAVSSKVADRAAALSGAVQGTVVKRADKAVPATGTRAKRQAATAPRRTAKTARAVAAAPKKAVVRAKRKIAA